MLLCRLAGKSFGCEGVQGVGCVLLWREVQRGLEALENVLFFYAVGTWMAVIPEEMMRQ